LIQAVAFRFLRQASRPKAPRPVTKSGSAPGSGTADHVPFPPASAAHPNGPTHQNPLANDLNSAATGEPPGDTIAIKVRATGAVPGSELN